MIVTCRNCNSRFNLDGGLVKKTGSKVRCSKCKHIFVIYPDESPERVAPPPETEVESPGAPEKEIDRESETAAAPTPETEIDEPPAVPEAAGDAAGTSDELNLSEIEKMLEIEGIGEEKATTGTAEDAAEMAAGKESTGGASLDELDLSEIEKILDMDQSFDDAEEFTEAEPEELIFDLEDSAESSGQPTLASDEFELADIEKMLDEHAGEMGGAAAVSEAPGDVAEESAEELDLSELEGLLASTDGDAKVVETAPETPEPVEGPDLSGLEEMMETQAPIEATPDEDELKLDLGDLEVEEPPEDAPVTADEIEEVTPESEDAAPASSAAPESVEELDFSSLEEMIETEAPPKEAPAVEDELGELKLELESEGDTPAESKSESVEELDFSGLEEMMETEESPEEIPPEETSAVEDELGELKLELESDAASAEPSEDESGDELDFSGLEEMMADEASPEEAADGSGDAEDLELSGLDKLMTADAPAQEEAAGDEVEEDELHLEFDESDEAEAAEEEPEQPLATDEFPETEDLDLEFDEEQLGEELGETEEVYDQETVLMETPAAAAAADAVAAPAEIEEKPAPKKKRSKLPLIILLILILLASAAAGGFLYMRKTGMKIPFLDAPAKPEKVDSGNLKIVTTDIDSRFVENKEAGRLFVITGMARNGYDAPRSLIRITGKLYSKGKTPKEKKLQKTETVYCGNVISDLELSKEPLEKIKKRLGLRAGDNNANVNIKPGEERPFMVVFSSLPGNLDEFTLEVAGSEPTTPPK